MFSGQLCHFPARRSGRHVVSRAARIAIPIAFVSAFNTWGAEAVSSSPNNSKHIIGATATLTEVSTGISFPARIDTGAQSCSLHVERIEIKDESTKRLENVGKNVRFLVRGPRGKTEWIETTIAKAVRVKSASLGLGQVDRRYKVLLTLQWKDFRKQVLVTLNDRTDMEYPLLIGRNFLRGDFLVDVDKAE
jgi:hypothetical protein